MQTAAFAAAADVGAGAALLHGGTLGVTALGRNGGWYVLPPPGAQYPKPPRRPTRGSATELYGKPVGRVLGDGQVILSATSAGLFGAAAGDVVQVRRWDNGGVARVHRRRGDGRRQAAGRAGDVDRVGREHRLRAPDQRPDLRLQVRPGGDEARSPGTAWPAPTSGSATRARAAPRPTRRSTWPRPRPSSGSSGTSRPAAGTSASTRRGSRPTWSARPSPASRSWPPATARSCPPSRVRSTRSPPSGLAGAIDVTNTNRYGGCFAPREVRSDGGTTGGNLSRHTWGMALDMNTATNPMGGVPTMDCRVVWIFRKWGFAWGGNFTTPDGMHFEWVGEDRSQISYPSRYCPNPVAAAAGARAQSELPSSAPSMQEPSEGEWPPARPASRPSLPAEPRRATEVACGREPCGSSSSAPGRPATPRPPMPPGRVRTSR